MLTRQVEVVPRGHRVGPHKTTVATDAVLRLTPRTGLAFHLRGHRRSRVGGHRTLSRQRMKHALEGACVQLQVLRAGGHRAAAHVVGGLAPCPRLGLLLGVELCSGYATARRLMRRHGAGLLLPLLVHLLLVLLGLILLLLLALLVLLLLVDAAVHGATLVLGAAHRLSILSAGVLSIAIIGLLLLLLSCRAGASTRTTSLLLLANSLLAGRGLTTAGPLLLLLLAERVHRRRRGVRRDVSRLAALGVLPQR